MTMYYLDILHCSFQMLSDISEASYISIDFTVLIWALKISAQKYLACVYLQLIHIVVWQKPMQHCKAIILEFEK